MSTRRLANEAAEAAKKWCNVQPDGLNLKPARGSLGSYPMERRPCPIQRVKLDAYRLPCSHFVGVDAAHEILTASAYDTARAVISCPTCKSAHPVAVMCMDCPGFRPFAWECPECCAPRCAACLAGCDFCDECGAKFNGTA